MTDIAEADHRVMAALPVAMAWIGTAAAVNRVTTDAVTAVLAERPVTSRPVVAVRAIDRRRASAGSNRVVTAAIDHVVAAAAGDHVVAMPAINCRWTTAGSDRIGTVAGIDDRGATAAGDHVGAVPAIDRRRTAAAGDRVGAATAKNHIGAAAAGDHVGAVPAKDRVRSAAAGDRVGAAAAEDHIGAIAAHDCFGPAAAEYRIVAGAGLDRVGPIAGDEDAVIPGQQVERVPLIGEQRNPLITVRQRIRGTLRRGHHLEVESARHRRGQALAVRRQYDIDRLTLCKERILPAWNRCHSPIPSIFAVKPRTTSDDFERHQNTLWGFRRCFSVPI